MLKEYKEAGADVYIFWQYEGAQISENEGHVPSLCIEDIIRNKSPDWRQGIETYMDTVSYTLLARGERSGANIYIKALRRHSR